MSNSVIYTIDNYRQSPEYLASPFFKDNCYDVDSLDDFVTVDESSIAKDYYLVNRKGKVYSVRTKRLMKWHLRSHRAYVCFSPVEGESKLSYLSVPKVVLYHFDKEFRKMYKDKNIADICVEIIHKDGNPANCDIDNLKWRLIDSQISGPLINRITVKDNDNGELLYFPTISKVCKFLGTHYPVIKEHEEKGELFTKVFKDKYQITQFTPIRQSVKSKNHFA